jgi:hypothetical protein
MAAPLAYEQPTFQRSWDAFLLHIPVLVAVWVASLLVTLVFVAVAFSIYLSLGVFGDASDFALGLASTAVNLAQVPFSILSSLIGVLMVAVPAMYYEQGETVTIGAAFSQLTARFWRYVLAGIFFGFITTIGFVFCILPGIAVALVTPVYVNRIFVTDMSIGDAFSQSFQAVYRSENGMSFLGLEILTGLLVAIATIVTCGLGALVAVPMGSFYLQNAAYKQGLLR